MDTQVLFSYTLFFHPFDLDVDGWNNHQCLLAVEHLILKTICFNFTAQIPFPYVIKLGKELRGISFLMID